MKAALARLPAGCVRLRRIDLVRNRRELRIVVAMSTALLLAMIAGMALVVPVVPALKWLFRRPLALLALAAAMVAYIVLHELVHGLFIRIFSGRRARYGFSWAYAYAGSDFYFPKGPYLVIALAPAVLWGLAFAALQAAVRGAWVWWVFLLQTLNVSGAAGDFYTAWVVVRMPGGVCIRDTGTAMEIFGAPGERSA